MLPPPPPRSPPPLRSAGEHLRRQAEHSPVSCPPRWRRGWGAGRLLTFAELGDTEAEPDQEPSGHRVLHDPFFGTGPQPVRRCSRRGGGQGPRGSTAGQAATPPLTANSGRCLLPAALPSTNSWRGRERVGGRREGSLLSSPRALAQRWASFGSCGSQPPLRGGPSWGSAAGRGGAREPRAPGHPLRQSQTVLRRRCSPGLGCGAADLENNEA